MKVLILVQSVNKGEYPELRKAQQETWDSVNVPNVKTLYYYPSPNSEKISGLDMTIQGPDQWGYMFMQTMKAFRNALSLEWDFLFKTDNSAYVDKKELYNLLTTKPMKEFYGGHKLSHPTHGDFLWGEGVALSRDVVESLVEMYILQPWKRMGVEDAHIGSMLKDKLTWDESMTIPEYSIGAPQKSHVYRCKKNTQGDTLGTLYSLHHYFSPSSIAL
jgi:hypothetical protein